MKMKKALVKFLLALAIVPLVLMSLSACGANDNSMNADAPASNNPVYPQSIVFDDYNGKAELKNNNLIDANFIQAVNYFTNSSTSKLLANQTTNICYSPTSLYFALSLAATGANGETQSQMFKVLGIDKKDKSYLNAQIGSLYRSLYFDNSIGKLKIANSLLISNEQKFKESYIKTATENFYSSLYNVDFKDENTAKNMSKWISDNTNGILSPKIQLNKNQIMAILNTVYFKDEWTTLFDNSKTKKDIFNLSDGTKTECDFMNSDYTSYGYTKGEGFLSSALYLKNGESMNFILPDKDKSINDLISSPEKIDSLLTVKNESHGKVIFQIPKFSYGSELKMNDSLKLLGMKSAFDINADFTGITDGGAFISDVNQQTHITIDEKGVEAAAFTRIDFEGSEPPNDNLAEIILDRPFIFSIKSSTGTVLFVGIVNNPTSV